MNNHEQTKRTISSTSYNWIILAWLAAISAMPVCFSVLFAEPMSPYNSHEITKKLIMLTVSPAIAIVASFKAFRQTRFTAGRFVLLIVPAVLSLLELWIAFHFLRAM